MHRLENFPRQERPGYGRRVCPFSLAEYVDIPLQPPPYSYLPSVNSSPAHRLAHVVGVLHIADSLADLEVVVHFLDGTVVVAADSRTSFANDPPALSSKATYMETSRGPESLRAQDEIGYGMCLRRAAFEKSRRIFKSTRQEKASSTVRRENN